MIPKMMGKGEAKIKRIVRVLFGLEKFGYEEDEDITLI